MMRLLVFLFLCKGSFGLFAQEIAWHNNVMFTQIQSSVQLQHSEMLDGKWFRLLEFKTIPSSHEIQKLSQQGIQLLEFIPPFSYLASVDGQAISIIESLIANTSIQVFDIKSDHKIEQQLLDTEHRMQSQLGVYAIQWYKGLNDDVVVKTLQKLQIYTLEVHTEERIIYVECYPNQIFQIAQLTCVQHVSKKRDTGEPEDQNGKNLHRVHRISRNVQEGLFFDGEGIGVLVRDDGPIGPHIDFKGRLTQQAFGLGTHGDMVSGILAGGGNINPDMQGMAPASTLHVINYQSDFLDNTLDLHIDNNVMITNSSYSDGCNEGYTLNSQIVDQQLYDYPHLLHVFSAGNSNNMDCGYGAGTTFGNVTGGHKIAKNCLTTANLNYNLSINNTSSIGPTKDGRLKPEIAARGAEQQSTFPNNTYGPGGGTSAASPGVAGTTAVLYQAYKVLHKDSLPKSALIKACLMNTATDLGNPGPDYTFGFGHLHAYDAYQALKNQTYAFYNMEHKEKKIITLDIPADIAKARIMLYWSEASASLNAKQVLINDFNLTVTLPNNIIQLPLVLKRNPVASDLGAIAKPGIDSINNVEQIVLLNPEAGTYTIQISADRVPFGNAECILVYHFDKEEVVLQYPIGGESMVAGSIQQLQWDASGTQLPIILEYSDNNGMSWERISTLNGSARLYEWRVPGICNADVIVRVTQGNMQDVSSRLSICIQVERFQIAKRCPESVLLTWSADTKFEAYQILRLKDTKMELVAETFEDHIELSIPALEEEWFSIQGVIKQGTHSRRTNAIAVDNQLLQCDQSVDAALYLTQKSEHVYFCNTFSTNLDIEIENMGHTDISSFEVWAIIQGVEHRRAVNQTIKMGERKVFRLDSFIETNQTGLVEFEINLDVQGDGNIHNNKQLLQLNISKLNGPVLNIPSKETFSINAIPVNWIQQQTIPVNLFSTRNVVGKSGATRALRYYNNNGFYIGTKQSLLTPRYAIAGAEKPYLFLTYAYHMHSNNINTALSDSVKIYVLKICDGIFTKELLFNSGGNSLQTVSQTAVNSWTPDADTAWQVLAFDLSAYKNETVAIEFEFSAYQSNNLYIDDVEIKNLDVELSYADFQISNLNPCVLQTIDLKHIATGIPANKYLWSVPGNVLGSKFEGEGPIKVRYSQVKEHLASLTVFGLNNVSTINKWINVHRTPISNFTFTPVNSLVNFKNRGSNLNQYVWYFGDGDTSHLFEPLHLYLPGSYEVRLVAYNLCDTVESKQFIELGGTAVNELGNGSKVYPNPFKNEITIEAINNLEKVELYDQSLQYMNDCETTLLENGNRQIRFKNISEGVYILKLITVGKIDYVKIVKL